MSLASHNKRYKSLKNYAAALFALLPGPLVPDFGLAVGAATLDDLCVVAAETFSPFVVALAPDALLELSMDRHACCN